MEIAFDIKESDKEKIIKKIVETNKRQWVMFSDNCVVYSLSNGGALTLQNINALPHVVARYLDKDYNIVLEIEDNKTSDLNNFRFHIIHPSGIYDCRCIRLEKADKSKIREFLEILS